MFARFTLAGAAAGKTGVPSYVTSATYPVAAETEYLKIWAFFVARGHPYMTLDYGGVGK